MNPLATRPPPATRGEVSRRDGGGLPALCAAIVAAAVLLIVACSEDPAPPTQPTEPQQTREQPAEQQQQDARTQQNQQQETPQPSATQTEQQPQQAQQEQEQEQAPADSEQQQVVEQQTPPPTPTLQPILGGHQFHQPIEMLQLPDGSLLVAEQRGYVTRFVEDDGEIEQFGILDITESTRFGGEQGLLSIALHPDLQNEPFLFVYYSPRDANVTRLSRFRIVQGAALTASELVIIEVPQPYSNHNGGAVRFGPDGCSTSASATAARPTTRRDTARTARPCWARSSASTSTTSTAPRPTAFRPTTRSSASPASAPKSGPTDSAILGEWPSICPSGLLWVGDVGQDLVEEIAVVEAGENHGWNIFEGDQCFRSEEDCAALTDAVPPLAVYGHDEGCSVTGGMVYRGDALPHLSGVYIFGDYCSGTIWGLWPNDSAETGWTRDLILETDQLIASFAIDNKGEIYVLAFNAPILKLTPD